MTENIKPEHTPEQPGTPNDIPAGYDAPAKTGYETPSHQAPAAPVAPEARAYEQPTYQQPGAQQGYPQQNMQQPYQQPAYNAAPGTEQKSKVVAGILGILLGSLGIHNFYLGKTKIALIQLLVSVISLGILAPLMAIWGLVEGILILVGQEGYRTDVNGVPLKD